MNAILALMAIALWTAAVLTALRERWENDDE
jgi:hypothetical protein